MCAIHSNGSRFAGGPVLRLGFGILLRGNFALQNGTHNSNLHRSQTIKKLECSGRYEPFGRARELFKALPAASTFKPTRDWRAKGAVTLSVSAGI
jgi:hypothetical protein